MTCARIELHVGTRLQHLVAGLPSARVLLASRDQRDLDVGVGDEREVPEPAEADAARDGVTTRLCQHRLEAPSRRPPRAPHVPVPTERRSERDRGIVLAHRLAPVERGGEVVVPRREHIDGGELVTAEQRRAERRRDVDEVQRVRASCFRCKPERVEPLGRVVPDRDQQAERSAVGGHQRLGDEPADHVDDVTAFESNRAAHRLGVVHRETVAEHRECGQRPPFVVEQQLVAPVDERSQRLMTRHGGAPALAQNAEAVAEARRDLGR